jgi:ABC-type multidrug transport system fused ATPase/permease subunit
MGCGSSRPRVSSRRQRVNESESSHCHAGTYMWSVGCWCAERVGLRRTRRGVCVGPPEAEHPLTGPAGQLDVGIEHVFFQYRSRSDDDQPPVLVDIDAHIPAGEHVALVGETGSGKTTLGRLVARFADPTAGTVRIGGVPLTAVSNDVLRDRLIVVPQEPFLFDGTIASNLGFAKPGLSIADLEAAIDALDLRDWLDAMPDGTVCRRRRVPTGCSYSITVVWWRMARIASSSSRAASTRRCMRHG